MNSMINIPIPEDDEKFEILLVKNFGISTNEPWCRIDIFEVKSLVASFLVSFDEFVIDGTTTSYVEKPPKLGFNSVPSRNENLRVSRVRKCVGKGVHFHTDESKNIWCTRKGKNPVYVKGQFLGDGLNKLSNELEQGTSSKIMDRVRLNKYLSDIKITNRLSTNHLESCKVIVSFIKDPLKDEELPLWIEIWIISCVKKIEGFLKNIPIINVEASLPSLENIKINSLDTSSNTEFIRSNTSISINKKEKFTNTNSQSIFQEMRSKNLSPLIDRVPIKIKDTNVLNVTNKPTSIISSISSALFRSKTNDDINLSKKKANFVPKVKDSSNKAKVGINERNQEKEKKLNPNKLNFGYIRAPVTKIE